MSHPAGPRDFSLNKTNNINSSYAEDLSSSEKKCKQGRPWKTVWCHNSRVQCRSQTDAHCSTLHLPYVTLRVTVGLLWKKDTEDRNCAIHSLALSRSVLVPAACMWHQLHQLSTAALHVPGFLYIHSLPLSFLFLFMSFSSNWSGHIAVLAIRASALWLIVLMYLSSLHVSLYKNSLYILTEHS